MVQIFSHKSRSKKYYYVRYSGELGVSELDSVLKRFLIDFSDAKDVIYVAEFTPNSFVVDKDFVKKGVQIGQTMLPFLQESVTIGLKGILRSLFAEYISAEPVSVHQLKRTFYKSIEEFEKVNVLSLSDDFFKLEQFPNHLE